MEISKNDIPLQVGKEAYNWISMGPDKRAAIRRAKGDK